MPSIRTARRAAITVRRMSVYVVWCIAGALVFSFLTVAHRSCCVPVQLQVSPLMDEKANHSRQSCSYDKVRKAKKKHKKTSKHPPDPIQVGDLLTQCVGTDRYGFRVIEVAEDGWTLKCASMQQDPQTKHPSMILRWNSRLKNGGGWIIEDEYEGFGRHKRPVRAKVAFGVAETYLDPHF